ncbi:hypothetical protein V6N13_028914, partial [Hibiscus sabdariffa]
VIVPIDALCSSLSNVCFLQVFRKVIGFTDALAKEGVLRALLFQAVL